MDQGSTTIGANLMNSKTATSVDENWTFDGSLPVQGASSESDFLCDSDQDGEYAAGECTKNPAFGQPNVFQRPFRVRVGAKLTF